MSRFAILAVLLLLLVAACGGDDEDSDASDAAASNDAVAAEVSDDSSDDAVEEEAEEEEASEPEETDDAEAEDAASDEATENETRSDDAADTEEAAEDSDEGSSDEPSGSNEVEMASESDFEVTNVQITENASGNIDVVGEIHNVSDRHLVVRDVDITLLDSSGAAITKDWAHTIINLVPVGEFAPFTHTFWDLEPDEVADADIEIDAVFPSEEQLAEWERYYGFDVLSIEWNAGDAGNSVVAEIENSGDESAELAQFFAAGYDADGTLLFVASSYLDADVVEPGDIVEGVIDWLPIDLEEPAEIRGWIQAFSVLESA